MPYAVEENLRGMTERKKERKKELQSLRLFTISCALVCARIPKKFVDGPLLSYEPKFKIP